MKTLKINTVAKSARQVSTAITACCLLVSHLVSASVDSSNLEEVNGYQVQGKHRTAIILLKNIIQERPEDAQARMALGKSYLSIGRLSSAEKEINKAYQLDPENPEIRISLAKTLFQRNKFKQLKPLLSEIQGWPPELIAEAYAIQAQVKIHHGELEEAKKILINALQVNKKHPQVLYTQALLEALDKQFDEAKKYLEQLLAQDSDHARGLALLGGIALVNKEYQSAIQLFGKVSELQTNNVVAKVKLAQALIADNQLEEAKKQLEAVLEVAPYAPYANYLQATIALVQKDYDKAVKHADVTLTQADNHVESLYISATANYSLTRFERAYEQIIKVIQRAPNHAQSLKLKAALELRLGLTDDATATLSNIDVEMLQSQDAALLVAAGMASLKSADYESGKRLFQQAGALDSDDQRIHLGQADIAINEGDWDAAISELINVTEKAPESQGTKVALVMSYLNNKQPDKAIEAAQNLSKTHPQSSMGATLEGWAYLIKEDFDSAETAFQQALTIEPGSPKASHFLAVLAIRKNNDVARARRLHETVIKHHPENLRSLLQLAGIDQQAGNYQQAVRWLEQAAETNPEALRPHLLLSQHYLGLNKPAQALDISEKILPSYPDDPGLLAVVGEAQRLTGQPEQAITTFKKLRDLEPDKLSPQYRLAGLYAESDQLGLARDAVDKALSINPEHLGALYVSGRIALKSGDTTKADGIVQRLQAAVPDNAFVMELQAQIALAAGHPSQAVESYRKALKTRESSSINIELASALWQQKKQDEAIATLTQWLDRYPEDTLARKALADFYLRENQQDNARKQFEEVVRHMPNNAQVQNNLAWLLLKGGSVDTALSHAQQARKLAPNSPEVMDTLGLVLLEKGHHRAAERLFVDAAALLPKNLDIQFHLAQVNAKAGKKEKAEQILVQILSLENNNAPFSYREAAERLLSELRQSLGPATSG